MLWGRCRDRAVSQACPWGPCWACPCGVSAGFVPVGTLLGLPLWGRCQTYLKRVATGPVPAGPCRVSPYRVPAGLVPVGLMLGLPHRSRWAPLPTSQPLHAVQHSPACACCTRGLALGVLPCTSPPMGLGLYSGNPDIAPCDRVLMTRWSNPYLGQIQGLKLLIALSWVLQRALG